jgi:hypothetical protein
MIPELLSILGEHKRISLTELSLLAKISEEVVEQIMEQLVRKQQAKKETIRCQGCMKDCMGCVKRGDLIFYEKRES